MDWILTPYTVALAISVLVAGSLAGYGTYRVRREGFDPTIAAFAFLMGVIAYGSLLYALRLSSTDPGSKHLFHRANFSRALITYAWLLFALAYTDRDEWLTRRRVGLLGSYPLLYEFVITPTGFAHSLVARSWSRYTVDAADSFFVLYKDPAGIGHTLVVWWAYAQGLAGILLFLWMAVRSRKTYRGQSVLIATGSVAPLIIDGLFRFGLSPVPHVELTYVSFTVSGVIFATAIFRYQLLDLIPVARDRVIDSMRDGYVVIDEDGQIIDNNPAAGRLLTGDEHHLAGRSLSELLPSISTLDAAETPPEAVTVDPPHGQQRFVEVDVSPLDGDGSTLGRLVTLRDVTDRRRIEKRYQALIEHSSDAIVLVDAEGDIEYASPSVETILGAKPKQIEGLSALDLVHPEDVAEARAAVESLPAGSGTTRIEFRAMTADGSYRDLEAIASSRLHDPDIAGIVVNARDVTERKERERALRRQNERLDEFAGIVSHDLRNPLTTAKGYLDLAQTADSAEYLPRVEQSLDRIETIIDDVLALAREGEAVGETEPVSIAAVARQSWDTVETVEMTLDVAATGTIAADRDRLMRLFENLYRNAREHAGETVTVRVGAVDDGFYIEDDGPGIPEDKRDEVLESGYTTESDGTGFGLAIVSRIVEAHDWAIIVAESPAGGARFEVTGVEQETLTDDGQIGSAEP
jgi:PAS domain S-box-containing protein